MRLTSPACSRRSRPRQPDAVLTDIRMPPTGTDEGHPGRGDACASLHPGVGVVVLSQYAEPAYALELLDGGPIGSGLSAEGTAVRRRAARRGNPRGRERRIGRRPKVVEVLVGARTRSASSPLERLTPRELEVLGEIAQGKNNAAVAASLVLSERAVEKHINSLFSKLGLSEEPDVHRRVKAVLLYLAEPRGASTTTDRGCPPSPDPGWARHHGSVPCKEDTIDEVQTVSVLIVDDQPPFRAVARTVVDLAAGFEVVGEAETGEEAVEQAAATLARRWC